MLMGNSDYGQHHHHHQQPPPPPEVVQWPRNPMAMDRRWKANIEVEPNCPRCASTNTKFCYYNNYSLSQPRYFCKGCRRYWTKGGSLRNVPVGGGCRKSRRARSSSAKTAVSSSSSSTSYSPSTSTSGDDKASPSDASMDFDLAAVFARFLNNNSTTTTGTITTTNVSAGDNDDDDVDNYMEMARPVDVEDHQDIQLQTQLQHPMEEGLPEVIIEDSRQQEQNIKQVIAPTDNKAASAFDEVVQDVLWSDMSTFDTSWQLPVTEFEDEFMKSTNQLLLSDNVYWSCFDLTPNEIFSRPSQF